MIVYIFFINLGSRLPPWPAGNMSSMFNKSFYVSLAKNPLNKLRNCSLVMVICRRFFPHGLVMIIREPRSAGTQRKELKMIPDHQENKFRNRMRQDSPLAGNDSIREPYVRGTAFWSNSPLTYRFLFHRYVWLQELNQSDIEIFVNFQDFAFHLIAASAEDIFDNDKFHFPHSNGRPRDHPPAGCVNIRQRLSCEILSLPLNLQCCLSIGAGLPLYYSLNWRRFISIFPLPVSWAGTSICGLAANIPIFTLLRCCRCCF